MLSAAELKALVVALEGGEIARVISVAFFALYVYEYMITVDEEITYFWSGKWTASRVLFLLNRYIPPMIMLLGLLCFFIPNPTDTFCRPAIQVGFVSNIGAIGVIQAILVLRVWYLFSDSKIIRGIVVSGFVLSNIISLTFASIAAHDLRLLPILEKGNIDGVQVDIVGCRAARPDHFWRMFFPSLILHTLLYILTAIRALRNRHVLANAPILKKLLRDGGFFYFVVFVTVGFTSIGSFFTQYPKINTPIVFSNYLIAVNSIAVSRVLLSIHGLAEKIGSDADWLLNNAELSRSVWRRGANKGEIVIDKWTVEEDEETGFGCDDGRVTPMSGRATPMKMTKIGVWKEDAW